MKRTKCIRCNGITKKGERCKRMTCIWSPMCHWHTNIEVKQSKIPKSGRGGFAKKDLKKDTIVGNYTIGTHKLSLEQLKKLYPNSKDRTHIWQQNDDVYYDARNTRSVAGMFNNCTSMDYRKIGCRNAAKITAKFGNIKLTRNVKKGDEIYKTYGPGFGNRKVK